MEALTIKEQFIELRAKGESYDKIAKTMGKAKQTLIDWGKELQEEIANRKALELEALYEKHDLAVLARLETFGEMLAKLKKELLSRDLTDVPTDKLLDLFLKYSVQAKAEHIEPTFKTTEDIAEEKQEEELLERFISHTPKSEKLKAV